MSVLAWLDQFISALEPAFLQILNMSITASYVTLAVLLVRLLLRRAAEALFLCALVSSCVSAGLPGKHLLAFEHF